MAARDTFVTFFSASNKTVYFTDFNEDVDNDSFMQRCARLNWIKSKDNKFLILNESDEFQAQNLSIEEEKSHPEHKFNVHIYKNSDKEGPRAVILYTFQGKKKAVVCCNDKLEIQPVEMEIPKFIPEKAHKALFYRTEVSPSCYCLESSLYPSNFLAFEPDANDPSLNKLVLRQKEPDELDIACHITMLSSPASP